MAGDDQNQNQNQQQNQGKQKGDGGQKGGAGIALNASFNAATAGDLEGIKTQALGHAANAAGFIGGMFLAALIFEGLKQLFNIKTPAPVQQGGGGGPAISHPGQIAKAINQLKSHPQMGEFLPKIKEALGE